jgi:secreted trypsin-like serine protease
MSKRWRTILLALVGTLLLAACGANLATVPEEGLVTPSITYGQLDGDGHPFVGLMVAKNAAGAALWRCSGTLLSSTVFLTAGHCVEAPAARVELWFDADMRDNSSFPLSGTVSGTPHVFPSYYDGPFFLADVGVVVLDKPMTMSTYGVLPTLNSLDALKTRRGQQLTSFTAVGYGLQRINPVFIEAERVRMVATPHLVQINVPGFTGDFSMLLSNNASTGGTCFGDSGGPNFLGSTNVVAGVTSFGINGNCAGTGGVFRMDRAGPLNWVKSFLP